MLVLYRLNGAVITQWFSVLFIIIILLVALCVRMCVVSKSPVKSYCKKTKYLSYLQTYYKFTTGLPQQAYNRLTTSWWRSLPAGGRHHRGGLGLLGSFPMLPPCVLSTPWRWSRRGHTKAGGRHHRGGGSRRGHTRSSWSLCHRDEYVWWEEYYHVEW